MLEFTEEEIKDKYPLHWCVWNGNSEELDGLLITKLYNSELPDSHGRTPLLLAVSLGSIECVKVLLNNACDASATDKQGWNVTQEAVGTGDPDLIGLIIQHREYQKFTQKTGGISDILDALEQADDFYVEMKWEFSSWIPLISRMCPNDSYKIYKSGAAVRVDTTLKGFEQMNWKRGNQSFIFTGGTRVSELYEVDHDNKSYWKESVSIRDDSMTLDSLQPPPSIISSRLGSQNSTSVLDHENISFARQKSGLLGWGGDKTDTIDGYEAKVYSVANVELITRTRTEHLCDEDRHRVLDEKKKAQSQIPAVLNFLSQNEREEVINTEDIKNPLSFNPYTLTIEEYFNPKLHPGKDVGKLRKMTSRTQKFTATVALSDDYPLSLQDQVLPIINLMANSSSHFAKLRDFITLQLPAGFPLKIEIPLFHVLNACITFANINGSDQCPDGVVVLEEPFTERSVSLDGDSNEESSKLITKKKRCIIDKSIFEVHHNYRDLGTDVSMYRDIAAPGDEEDELLQLAIQQSLANSTTSSNEDVLTDQTWTISSSKEDEDIQRAIRESMGKAESSNQIANDKIDMKLSEEEQLRMVLSLSLQEGQNIEERRRTEEEELQRILALSIVDH